MWGLPCQLYMNALVNLKKNSCQNISGVHTRTHTDPLFMELKLLRCDGINKYLGGWLIYRICHEDMTLFDSVLIWKKKFTIITPIKGITIMYLALNQDLTKSICDTTVLLFGIYCLVVSLLMPHGDVIKWKHFPRYWPFVRGIHRSPMNSQHKHQWRRALVFSLICARINGWVNNREAGDLRRHRAHYDVIVMSQTVFSKQLKCAIIYGPRKIIFLEYIYDINH